MSSGAESVPRLILDTSAYSRLRHGHETVLDLVANCQLVSIPMIVLGELEAGYELGARPRENRAVLGEFLDEPYVSVLPVTRAVTRRYGQVFAQLRRAGTPIPINDVWIAATTLDSGGHLLTFDEDFSYVDSLDCTILSP
jgi:tRNA(fMet)-specific endonuclease VapC